MVETISQSEIVKTRKMMESKDKEMSSLGKKIATNFVKRITGHAALNDEILASWMSLFCSTHDLQYWYTFHKSEEDEGEDIPEAV